MLIVILFILFFIFVINNKSEKVEKLENCNTCTKSNKSKLDPIMDPKYNITEVIKNSLLLEDHLNQKSKRCKDCICKHFLLLISYLTEALSLKDGDKIPEIEPSIALYNDLFSKWKSDKLNDSKLSAIASELRKNRKILTNKYILNE